MLDNPLIAIPAFAALLFIIVSNKATYKFTDKALGATIAPLYTNQPTKLGYAIHALVFFGLMYAYLRSFDAGLSTLGMTSFGSY